MNNITALIRNSFNRIKGGGVSIIVLFLCISGVFFLVLMFVFSSRSRPSSSNKVDEASSMKQSVNEKYEKGAGMFLSEQVDRKAYVERLEKQYENVSRSNEETTRKIRKFSVRLNEIARVLREVTKTAASVEAQKELVAQEVGRSGNFPGGPLSEKEYLLEVVNVSEVDVPENPDVYLPAGSFVAGTLLTGVYAPAVEGQGLPVLIRLNEAFVGPNESSVPLTGAFVLGKGSGDLNSERVLIDAETLSVVFSSGETFEQVGGFGYVTDINGQLGLKGVVVRNTARQLLASFMTGFMGGAAQAVSDGETSSLMEDGKVVRNITGNVVKHAAFAGMAQSSAKLSEYYQERLDAIVPAVLVRAGVEVRLVVKKGFHIHGLPKERMARSDYFD